MKQLVVLASLVLAAGTGLARAAEVDAQSRIEAVTVFPMGAEVTRVAKVQLDKGEHTILFRDLPASAVEGSIRVEGNATGKLDIGSVDTRKLFVPRDDAEAAATERRRVETEIEKLKDERATYEAQVQSAETQRSLITNLTQLPTRPAPAAGQERGEDWPQILALIASGLADVQRTLQDGQVKMRETDRKIADLEKALAEVAPDKTERTEAKVFVVAQSPLEADITVRYQVSHASWTPLYDVRLATGAKTVAPSVELTRRASISQRTGELWDNVVLTLSTTRPTAGAAAPELAPLIVDFEPPPAPPAPAPMATAPASGEGRTAGLDAPAEEVEADHFRAYDRAAAPKKEEIVERPAEVVQAPFHALFAVPGRLTIPETGEAKRVQLGTEAIEPELTIRTVPKVDAKAYLYAKFNLPKGSPLLPGAVSLFRDGTFVGSGRLPLLSPGEEHELGFGVDDLVRVRHSVSEEKRGETGLISTSHTDSRNYVMAIKSMHERAIALAVFDQVPVSANQDIRVELTGKTPPTRQNVDDKRGVLVWEGKLEPDQEQTIEFGYRVSWPSSKGIVYRQ